MGFFTFDSSRARRVCALNPQHTRTSHSCRLAALLLPLMALATAGQAVGASQEELAGGHPGTAHYAPAIGERSVAVILVNFLDKPGEPGSAQQAQAVLDGPVNDYFTEASFQQASLATDVFGWWTLPYMSSRCADTGAGLVSSEIQQEATERGVDLAGYDHLVYVFNDAYGGMCSGAVGTVSPGRQGKVWRSWPGATGTAEVAFDGTKGIEATIHELGHNLGLWHANRLGCGVQVLADSCGTVHYGDVYDSMGSGPIGPHFNAFHKERLGWLTPDQGSINRIESVTTSGMYTLTPYSETGGTKALKIHRGPGPEGGVDSFYLEYRQDFGWDSGFRPLAYQGILVRLGNDTEADSSHLLDMTPEEPFDHALLPGKVFLDPQSHIEIAVLQADPSGALVSVTLGNDLMPPEIVSMSPSQDSQLAKGGTTLLSAVVVDESAIDSVSFLVDGNAHCQAEPSGNPDEFSCPFQAPKGKSRTLQIEARATDTAGNSAQRSVTVNIGDATSGGNGETGNKGGGRKK